MYIELRIPSRYKNLFYEKRELIKKEIDRILKANKEFILSSNFFLSFSHFLNFLILSFSFLILFPPSPNFINNFSQF